MTVSPLAPDRFPDMPAIAGLGLATAASGLKYTGRDDMLLMHCDKGSSIAAVFTKSDTAAAPVQWSRDALASGHPPAAILVNAGNANAFTGSAGIATVTASATGMAQRIGCTPQAVLLASTGVIGEPLDSRVLEATFDGLVADISQNNSIENASDNASNNGDDNWSAAAAAIMTTDTFPKGASTTCMIGDVPVTLSGIAKGAGMIAPDMATMLGFIATDAALPAPALTQLLRTATERSFNAITVDSDTSTNDSVFLVATGAAGNQAPTSADDPILDEFVAALDRVMQDLACQIVRDGEGANKFITIDVVGASDDTAARKIALSIANSPLVKTAIAGEDANWGRIVMAVGKAGLGVDQSRVGIAIGSITVAADGMRVEGYDETPVAAHMAGQDVAIAVQIGDGAGTSRVWTCDLTHGYVDINADYRS
ncbi:MAG: bifunctional ornithine acetyltransferase/N-acetylglutamate synthase [SAR116 cluster bacterium MED-G05]|jgi:glutamate N-acetyltransferase/amino-acid N-acetyltransferase|nr:MAG: bifunctional ornithine acetyltransferase/N-acetylglutamate synthase [SAR116 cluster bacterium MED-G05]